MMVEAEGDNGVLVERRGDNGVMVERGERQWDDGGEGRR